jgi:hypothetical protein
MIQMKADDKCWRDEEMISGWELEFFYRWPATA